jgi:hypothetical protein
MGVDVFTLAQHRRFVTSTALSPMSFVSINTQRHEQAAP